MNNPDMAAELDLSGEQPDLRGVLGDLRGADLSGSDDMNTNSSCRGNGAPGALLKQATSTILLPKSSGSMTYTMDFDGDGKMENQLKTVVQALSVAGLDIQTPITEAVADGTMVYLVDLKTLKIDNSMCTGATLYLAKARGMGEPLPKYDGSDVFTKDPSAKAELTATVTANQLSSTLPKNLLKTEESRMDLVLRLGGMPLVLPLRGVHIQGRLADRGGKLFIDEGQLHGVVSKADIDLRVVPPIALMITQMINGDPTSGTTMTIISLFENLMNPVSQAKCMVAADCCRTSPATCKILPAEILASPIGGVLSPDVQVFNEMGEWAPVPGGTKKNGMSVGIGFTSVPATF